MPDPGTVSADAGATRGAVFLTGATGFVGQEVLCRYLTRSDRRILALIRAADSAEAGERLRAALDSLLGSDDAFGKRVSAVCGDVRRPRLGLDEAGYQALAADVTDIVHAAASVSFTLPLRESRDINVGGTRRVIEFARDCHRLGRGLRRLCHVSTAYVAGDHAGEFREEDLDVGQGFRNAYERSKFEAERLVRAQAAELPVVIVRPSIIVGERSHGWTSSFNVLYPPLKAFSRGAYPVLPARRSTPVDIVPVDYVAEAIFELCEHNPGRRRGPEVFHLVSGNEATSVGRLSEYVSRYFRRRPPRAVPAPIFRRLLYPLLVRSGGERRRRALRRTQALFPYFSMRVRFDDRRARARLRRAGIAPSAPESYLDRILDFAIAARWGRSVPPRHEVLGQR